MAESLSRALLTVDQVRAGLAGLPGVRTGPAGSLQVSLRAPSFLEAVRLVQLVAEQAEALDHHPDVDLRWRTVRFTVSTHSAGGVTGYDLELAGRILAAAAEVGATDVPPASRVEIGVDCVDVGAVRPFWRAVLGYRDQPDEDGVVELHHPTGQGPSLWFQPMDPPRTERNRLHLDVFLPTEQLPDRIRAALDAGGRLVSDAHAPSFWVLADPEGNEVCLCDWDDDSAADRP
jgi:4a-hydroxytetrahydrobiopterin dehydratase